VDPYDRLKTELPNIAKAVNEFKSEQVQQQAFRALLRALAGEAIPEAEPEEEVPEPGAADPGDGTSASAEKRRRRQAKAPASKAGGAKSAARAKLGAAPTLDKALDLRPKGKQSFKDFVDEKKPATVSERNAVAVYYLEKVAAVGKVNVNQVYTCFKEAGWRLPAYPRNALQVTASTKGWINTSDMDDMTMSPRGENFVEHDLPSTAKA
jgi:hypothetical protein